MKTLAIIALLTICLLTNASANDTTKYIGKDTTRLKIQAFNPQDATQWYLDKLSPETKAKSDAYFEGGYWLQLWNLLWEFAIAIVMLSFGLSKWAKRLAAKVKNTNLQNLIYINIFLALLFLLSFPINWYQTFYREHQYNLLNLNFAGWLGEEMLSMALTLVFGSLVIMLMYIAIRRVKNNWWIWAGSIAFVFMGLSLFVAPVFLAPLFNEYKPLPAGEIRDELLSLARANNIPADNIYQFDASKQTDRISANVSGIGSTIRISLNDNLLNQCTKAEIKAVMAHEMGHYVLNHTTKGLIYFGLVIFLGFAVVSKLFNFAVLRWGEKWQIKDISDIGGLPLLVFLFSLYLFVASPVMNNIIRINEVEADSYGLNAAGEPDGFASTAMKLSTYRKINPDYWEEIIFFDHPSGRNRVFMAMKWKAEHQKIVGN